MNETTIIPDADEMNFTLSNENIVANPFFMDE